MFQIAYASAARQPFSPEDLNTLLRKARARNGLYSVTGFLAYHQGSFLQVLEGEQEHVKLIFTSISNDSRHGNTRVLLSRTIPQRDFENWSMAFLDTSGWPLNHKGFVDYQRVLPTLANAPGAAHRYLRLFAEGLYRQVPAEDTISSPTAGQAVGA